jgi:amyotrophic lateral sclerosis 2 protein
VWQNVASIITKSHQKTLQRKKFSNPKERNISNPKERNSETIDQLDKIPCFGRDKLTSHTYNEVHKYLMKAFESPHHPLGALLTEVATVYTATYGGVRVHPLLLSHAVSELHSITSRIYEIVLLLFPALPHCNKKYVFETDDKENQYAP